MKKENKKGQTMKFGNAFYDFSSGVAIYSNPLSEYEKKTTLQTNKKYE